jgi:hypothetical protein
MSIQRILAARRYLAARGCSAARGCLAAQRVLATAIAIALAASAIPQGVGVPGKGADGKGVDGKGAASGAAKEAVPKAGKMRLWATVGSFRLEGHGKVEISFTGCLMAYRYEGAPPLISGKVRKEYQGLGRTAWFGTGKAVFEGKWRSLHWFGKNMNCTWVGSGLAMVFGEYDQKQDTGWVQVDDRPAYPWMTTGRTFWVPKEIDPSWIAEKKQPKAPPTVAPKGIKIG